jgi:hypothetical protein
VKIVDVTVEARSNAEYQELLRITDRPSAGRREGRLRRERYYLDY